MRAVPQRLPVASGKWDDAVKNAPPDIVHPDGSRENRYVDGWMDGIATARSKFWTGIAVGACSVTGLLLLVLLTYQVI